MNITLIDDCAAIGLGGAEMTMTAILDQHPHATIYKYLTKEMGEVGEIKRPDVLILGNLCEVPNYACQSNLMDLIAGDWITTSVQFDYGYIPMRGRVPHMVRSGQQYKGPEEGHGCVMLSRQIRAHANHIFYMSNGQRLMHEQDLGPAVAEEHVLSSCFTTEQLAYMRRVRTTSEKRRDRGLILDGRDEWQTYCKGVDTAKGWCSKNHLECDVVRTESNEELLDLMGTYNHYLLMPNIHDTCPRTAIEAKLCGIGSCYFNGMVQHWCEDWFQSRSPEEIENYIQARPHFFWGTVMS